MVLGIKDKKMWAKVESNQVTEIIWKPKTVTVDGIKYPENIFTLRNESDLNTLGFYKYSETERDPKKIYYLYKKEYTISGTNVLGTLIADF